MNIDLSISYYHPDSCASFLYAKDKYGPLSNMSNAFSLRIGNYRIANSEALYQALRFSGHDDIQRVIIEQKSPMAAKMKAKSYRAQYTRSDWEDVKVAIMWVVLQLKHSQNKIKMDALFAEAASKPIVEHSSRDDFWGCKLVDGVFIGQNVLGKLLTHMRDNDTLEFTPVENCTLLGESIVNDLWWG